MTDDEDVPSYSESTSCSRSSVSMSRSLVGSSSTTIRLMAGRKSSQQQSRPFAAGKVRTGMVACFSSEQSRADTDHVALLPRTMMGSPPPDARVSATMLR